ncbi:MAG: hypothetical protein ACR2PR_06615 [Pseudohongiellaceae bacterium]
MIKLVWAERLQITFPNYERTIMWRWGIRTPWIELCVHKIMPGYQHPHTHTQSFVSIILIGKYNQEIQRNGGREWKQFRPGMINHVRHDQPHKLDVAKPVWTAFCFYGAKHEAHVWYHWKQPIDWKKIMELVE